MEIPMRVAIEPRRLPMGGPSGVCNSDMRIKDLGQVWLLFCNEFLQLGNLAHLLERKNFILLVPIYGQTCGVISSIFQTRETFSMVSKHNGIYEAGHCSYH